MRRARYSLEEQVGGLVDRHDHRDQRRPAEPADEPGRYDVLRRSTPAIRATRAVGEATRNVA